MSADVEPAIRELAEKVIAGGGSKRAAGALRILLDKGSVSTAELKENYDHPPRVIGDIRDAGIPIDMVWGTSPTGRRMGVYSFGSVSNIQEGRIGGRSALPKKFKVALIARYGPIDCITGARLDERVLQIDHRIPYRIAGDAGLSDHDVEAYMLLDASSQRAKSWSCENCPNMLPLARVPEVCRRCFWAFPQDYDHIATEQLRRTDMAWQGGDVAIHDHLRDLAKAQGLTVADILLQLARAKANED